MKSKISFNGKASVQKAYFDRERRKYYAEISMQGGVSEFPDTSTKLKIPITSKQYDYFVSDSFISRNIRLNGMLEIISEE